MGSVVSEVRKPAGGPSLAGMDVIGNHKINMFEFSDFVNHAVGVLRSNGVDVGADSLDTSGELIRTDAVGRPGRKDCAYMIHADEPRTVWWMDWRTGEADTWSQSERLTDAARGILQERIAKVKREREAEQFRRHEDAAQKARHLYSTYKRSEDKAPHPYAAHKRLDFGSLVRRGEFQGHDCLVVPLYGEDGQIWSLEFIGPDRVFGSGQRDKTFLAGGRKKGCFLPSGPTFRGASRVGVAEGLATAAAIHDATGLPVVVAFDAGNLLDVGQVVRRLAAPNAEIMFCADDDTGSAKNPGMEAAEAAAKAVDGIVAVPAMGRKADFWDLWNERGPEAVRERIEAAQAVPTETVASVVSKPSAVVLCAADIRPESIAWIWVGYLASGKLHILGGAPGTGKTTLALIIAAIITRGGRYPDGSLSRMGRVLIWSGEDDPTDTIVPRLIAAGADLTRVHILSGISTGTETRPFDPATDMAELVRVVREIGDIRLIIVDPVVSAVAGDSHKNAEVRRSLQPLVTLGAETGAAILGITHFSKGSQGRDATERIVGSIAFAALARVVMVAAKRQDTEAGAGRVFARAKSNIGSDRGGFGYDLEQIELPGHPGVYASRVVWGEAIEGEARDILAQAEAVDDGDDGALGEAESFIEQMMDNGPVSAKVMQSAAREAGVSVITLKRAKKKMGILSERVPGSTTAWQWVCPSGSSGSSASTPKNVIPLIPLSNGAGSREDHQSKSIKGIKNIMLGDGDLHDPLAGSNNIVEVEI